MSSSEEIVQKEVTLNPDKLRKFIKHLALASARVEAREKKRGNISKHITEVKYHLQNNNSEGILESVRNLEKSINSITATEKTLLEKHNQERLAITSLKDTVLGLQTTLESIHKEYDKVISSKDKEYTKIVSSKDKEIDKLTSKLSNAHIKISDATTKILEHEKNKLKLDEKIANIKTKAIVKVPKSELTTTTPVSKLVSTASIKEAKKRNADINIIDAQLKKLEINHKSLVNSGNHSPKDLLKIEIIINKYKQRLSELKS